MGQVTTDNIIGAILAGGKSSRFGYQNKAQARLGGKSMLEHVIERLQPQVAEIVFSGEPIEGHQQHNWLTDALPGQKGPLVGVLSCLKHLQKTNQEWLLLAACDTPFLPADLGEKLISQALLQTTRLCISHDGERPQPTLSLWHRDLCPALEEAVTVNGAQGFKQFLDVHPHTLCKWTSSEKIRNAFININSHQELETAEKILDSKRF